MLLKENDEDRTWTEHRHPGLETWGICLFRSGKQGYSILMRAVSINLNSLLSKVSLARKLHGDF